MGRPRKESGRPTAQQRLSEAFWSLLESNQINEITVGILAAKAGCTRGTFYYHYEGIDHMIERIIEEELLKDNVIPSLIFSLVTGVNQEADSQIYARIEAYLAHISLLIEKGGTSVVTKKIKSSIASMWEAVFNIDGNGLTDETRLIIEFTTNGMLGIITYTANEQAHVDFLMRTHEFRKEMSSFLLSQISRSQDLPLDEVLSRLMLLGNFTKLSQD